jgi:uncharacterized protein YkwD
MSWRVRLLVPAIALTAVACSAPTAPTPLPDPSTPAPAPAPGPSPAPSAAATLVTLTNAERANAGLAILRAEGRLMHAAQLHADQMVAAGVMAHELPGAPYPTPRDRLEAAGYAWRLFGENIAFGQRTPAEAIGAWMASPGHRANMLNAGFTELGTGYAVDAAGRAYYVQVFGRPS